MAKDETQTDLARRMQTLFDPTRMAVPAVAQMLSAQQAMAGETEIFARHWIERRQQAVETGLEALREMSATNGADPMLAMRAITDWQRESFTRLNADLQDWVALCTRLTQFSASPQSGPSATATDRNADTPGPTRAGGRAASGARAQHATPV